MSETLDKINRSLTIQQSKSCLGTILRVNAANNTIDVEISLEPVERVASTLRINNLTCYSLVFNGLSIIGQLSVGDECLLIPVQRSANDAIKNSFSKAVVIPVKPITFQDTPALRTSSVNISPDNSGLGKVAMGQTTDDNIALLIDLIEVVALAVPVTLDIPDIPSTKGSVINTK